MSAKEQPLRRNNLLVKRGLVLYRCSLSIRIGKFLARIILLFSGHEIRVKNLEKTISNLHGVINFYDLNHSGSAELANVVLFNRVQSTVQTHSSMSTIEVHAIRRIAVTNKTQVVRRSLHYF